MTPIEILEDAQDKLDVFKNPDIQEARDTLNEVIKIATRGSRKLDKVLITDIFVGKKEISIDVYETWGNNEVYYIPTFIFEAEDYILEAKKYYSNKYLIEAEATVMKLKSQLVKAEKDLERAQNELVT